MAFDINKAKQALAKKDKTVNNPNIQIQKESKPYVKNIRESDFEVLRKYAFENDIKIIDAVGIAIAKLESNKDLKKIISTFNSEEIDYRSIRIKSDTMKSLKTIAFNERITMIDVISLAVNQLK
ncbi:hypothetical protein ACQKND_16395 [Viridibacillus arvi]|uniref:hypothetical protein n=1 Tax=Viridibacillus arvi TaxID=263475 RepID=UPI003D027C74